MLAATASPLWAQPYTLDENGNGTYNPEPTPSFPPMPVQVAPDPTGGITNSAVLIYNLEEPVAPGDVALMAPGQSAISKLLRFTTPDAQNNSHLIYYSQPDGTLAGVGIPATTNPVVISEATPMTTWFPKSNSQPGASVFSAIPVFQEFVYYIQPGGGSPAYLSGTNLIWNFADGISNAQFYVVASTNLTATNWTIVATNQFNQVGTCTLTLPVDPAKPCQFYRLALPTP